MEYWNTHSSASAKRINVLDVPVRLNHRTCSPSRAHSATTGRGKSNLVKVLLWSVVNDDDLGVLVLDPTTSIWRRAKNSA